MLACRADLEMHGFAKLLNPVMKLVFEKLANDTEKQMTTALNGLLAREQESIGTIIGAIVVGLIVGALARLIMPGKQSIGVIMTILLGAPLGVVHRNMGRPTRLGYTNENGGFEIVPFLVGIIVAVVLIAIYVGITGRRSTSRGTPVR